MKDGRWVKKMRVQEADSDGACRYVFCLGIAIKEARVQAGLSGKQLAHAAGYSSSGMICNIETGRNTLGMESLLQILAVLDLKPSQLLRRAEAIMAGSELSCADAGGFFTRAGSWVEKTEAHEDSGVRTRHYISSLGASMKEARIQAGLSGKQLAHAAGYSSSGMLCNIEVGGYSPKISSLVRLSNAMNIKPSQLMERAEHIMVTGEFAAGANAYRSDSFRER